MAFRLLQKKPSDIRAGRYNQSRSLFYFQFSLFAFNSYFWRMGKYERISQSVHTFRPPKFSHLYHFNMNINGDVSCRSVNWPLVTPRHNWFRQNRTHLTTYLRLENKLKEQSIAVHSPFFENSRHKNGFIRRMTNLPFLDIVSSWYSRSRMFYGRFT